MTTDYSTLFQRALNTIDTLQSKIETLEAQQTRQSVAEPIAIVGLGCRFPGRVNTPTDYWNLLKNGQSTITPFPTDRWNVDDYYDPNPDTPGKYYTRHASFLDQIDQFDPQFFAISPREAVSMDPQQRLLLEVTWEALEHGGIAPRDLHNSQTSVHIGCSTHDYQTLAAKSGDLTKQDVYYSTGVSQSVLSGRISYLLGLRGTSLTLDTACSSSLLAIHLACQELRTKASDTAIAGGINLFIIPDAFVFLSRSRMLSPDGLCKTFDASANGYVRGEGCGVLILKRLSDAIADGNRILATIRGSASNQDGRSNGLTAPSARAQEAVIRTALADARLTPAQISYIEAHGTGTALGDPIEMEALGAVYGTAHTKENPLLVGSVKTNIGHLEAAAGVASVIKVALALQNKTIPPHLNFNTPSPHIDWNNLPITIPTQLTDWHTPAGQPHLAAISAFGFSGTNVHLVIGDRGSVVSHQSSVISNQSSLHPAPDTPNPHPRSSLSASPSPHILALSAKTKPALTTLAQRYQSQIQNPKSEIQNFAFTSAIGRTHHRHRIALLADTPETAQAKLASWLNEDTPAGFHHHTAPAGDPPEIAHLFTGQGSQYDHMAHKLYQTHPTFRTHLNHIAHLLQPHLDLLNILYAPRTTHHAPHPTPHTLHSTLNTQPALFALQYALAQLWQEWGIEPAILMGHSVGEYTAACLAGVFSLEDGLKLISARGRLMQALPAGGTMAVIFTNETHVRQAIQPYTDQVSIAALNGPTNIVISGDSTTVQTLLTQFQAQGIRTQPLTVSHAFHSPLMQPILDDFRRVAESITYHPPQLPLISNVTGQHADHTIATPDYWVNHILAPVNFTQAITTLHQDSYTHFLEIGPKPTLLGMARRIVDSEQSVVDSHQPLTTNHYLPSLRPGRDDLHQLHDTLAQLYTLGADINWQAFYQHGTYERVELPTYPFQRQRYWFDLPRDPLKARRPEKGLHPLLTRQIRTPNQTDTIFETTLSTDHPAYFADHRIYDMAVFPGTGYLEIAQAVAQQIFGPGSHTISDILIQTALVLPDDQDRTLQAIATPPTNGQATCHIYSYHNDNWHLHATATLQPLAASRQPLANGQRPTANRQPPATLYEKFANSGMNYGNRFQCLQHVSQEDDTIVGYAKLPDSETASAPHYQLHPALLDACFHTIGLALPAGDVYVPLTINQYTLHQPGQTSAHIHTTIQQPNPDTIIATLELTDTHNQPIATIRDLRLQKASKAALNRLGQRRYDDWFYELTWEQNRQLADSRWPLADSQPPAASRQPPTASGQEWLIFADNSGIADTLATHLQERGDTCLLIRPGTLTTPDHYHRLISTLDDRYAGTLHLYSLDHPHPQPHSDGLAQQAHITASAVHLAQALAQRNPANRQPPTANRQPPPLWFITQHTQAVEGLTSATTPAALWGLARTLMQELPALNCRCLDTGREPIHQILAELDTNDDENQVAWRSNTRYVARLTKRQPPNLTLPSEGAYELAITKRGTLDNLVIREAEVRQPGRDEVTIRIHATGLNFRDVLNVLGMYPGDPGPIGGECAGTIVALGENVTDFALGDRVIAIVSDTFRSHITTPTDLVYPTPPTLTFAEAATLPITFLTAYYGLHHLAHIKPGDKILIHSAAGGVGMAAVQLARQAGATIFGTASTPTKRARLKAMGVHHTHNSRTLDFADEINHITHGTGINIILNSLADDFIPTSLNLLTDGGTFLEIGKRGVWSDQQVAALNPTLHNHIYDLATIMATNPTLTRQMMTSLLAQFGAQPLAVSRWLLAPSNQPPAASHQLPAASGQPPTANPPSTLYPLPLQAFPLTQAPTAFRYMAQAKHIGKIVLTQPLAVGRWPLAASPSPVAEAPSLATSHQPPATSYLITGGLGGLGLKIAQWLIDQGATHLVLMGRSAPSATAQAVLDELTAQGAHITLARGDVSRREDVARVLSEVPGVLKGVFHAAGVLDDGLFPSQTWPRFEKVLLPKAAGAWHLHQLTRTLPLDHFVLFSSMTAILGNAGQANYGSANAFLDGLARYRQSQGLSALSINWGAWGGVGMAAGLSRIATDQLASLGIHLVDPADGVSAMGQALESAQGQLVITQQNWSRFLAQLGDVPLLRRLAEQTKQSATPSSAQVSVLAELEGLDPAGQHTFLLQHIQQQIAHVLGLDPSQPLDTDLGLFDLGMDSLTAVELGNRLKTSLGYALPTTAAFDYPTITALTDFLTQQILPPATSHQPPATSHQPPVAEAPSLAHDDQPPATSHQPPTTDDEALNALLDELNKAGY